MSLHAAWRTKRFATRADPHVALVAAYAHTEDFPAVPSELASMFSSLPPAARVYATEDFAGVEATWTEPSTDQDRARLAEEIEEEADRVLFEVWRAANRKTAPEGGPPVT